MSSDGGKSKQNSGGETEPEVITFLRGLVDARQCESGEGLLVDVTTASTILAVYTALSTENQAKLAAMPLDKMALTAYRLARRQ